MRLVTQAAPQCDFAEWFGGFEHQFLSTLNATPDNEIVRTVAKAGPEGTRKVAGAKACQFAKVRNFYSLCQMSVDVSNDTSKLPWGEPPARNRLI